MLAKKVQTPLFPRKRYYWNNEEDKGKLHFIHHLQEAANEVKGMYESVEESINIKKDHVYHKQRHINIFARGLAARCAPLHFSESEMITLYEAAVSPLLSDFWEWSQDGTQMYFKGRDDDNDDNLKTNIDNIIKILAKCGMKGISASKENVRRNNFFAKLRAYGFEVIKNDVYDLSKCCLIGFSHPCFKRELPDQVSLMRRDPDIRIMAEEFSGYNLQCTKDGCDRCRVVKSAYYNKPARKNFMKQKGASSVDMFHQTCAEHILEDTTVRAEAFTEERMARAEQRIEQRAAEGEKWKQQHQEKLAQRKKASTICIVHNITYNYSIILTHSSIC